MSNVIAYAKIAAIALVNLGVVSCSSVFAVQGDGTPGGMYWILGLGALLVADFAARAFALLNRGDEKAAISLASSTLLYAFALALGASLVVGVLSKLV